VGAIAVGGHEPELEALFLADNRLVQQGDFGGEEDWRVRIGFGGWGGGLGLSFMSRTGYFHRRSTGTKLDTLLVSLFIQTYTK
jgi:hypothetical protein